MPRGGRRVGAGRKPWKNKARVIAGGEALSSEQSHASRVSSAVAKPKLPKAVGDVWDELAPRATDQGTLVPETAFEFRTLCEIAVEQRKCLCAAEEEGFTQLGLKIGAHYRGLTQRLETKLRAFKLAPMGKEIVAPAKDKPLTALEKLKQQRQGIHAVK